MHMSKSCMSTIKLTAHYILYILSVFFFVAHERAITLRILYESVVSDTYLWMLLYLELLDGLHLTNLEMWTIGLTFLENNFHYIL